jgi:hypothetical protein
MKSIVVDGVKYIEEKPKGKRAVVVVDRGWIFAGDVEEIDGHIILTRALHVFKWNQIGFSKVIDEPKSDKVDLRPIQDVIIPTYSEIFRIPVDNDWGL